MRKEPMVQLTVGQIRDTIGDSKDAVALQLLKDTTGLGTNHEVVIQQSRWEKIKKGPAPAAAPAAEAKTEPAPADPAPVTEDPAPAPTTDEPAAGES